VAKLRFLSAIDTSTEFWVVVSPSVDLLLLAVLKATGVTVDEI
jgi:hypothetical protein